LAQGSTIIVAMALSWLCVSALALREFNPILDKPLSSGTIGEVFVLPRKQNASGGAASLASTMSKVAAAFPEFDYVWVDTDEHKDWVEQELDVPEEYLPLILARLHESAEDRFWYEEFPFTRGIKEWLEVIKAGNSTPVRVLTSAEPIEYSEPVKDVVASTFEATVESGPLLLAVVADWCDHCKSLKPTLSLLAETMPVASFTFENNSYCGYEAKEGAEEEKIDVTGEDGEDSGLGLKQLAKVCWPAVLPLKRYKPYKWKSVPTLFYIAANEPWSPILYEGPRSVSAMKAFVAKVEDARTRKTSAEL
jgi:thiol-disulfide isomerase/thioredoxin